MKYLNVLQLCLQGAPIKVQKEHHLRIQTGPKVFFNICGFIFRGWEQEKKLQIQFTKQQIVVDFFFGLKHFSISCKYRVVSDSFRRLRSYFSVKFLRESQFFRHHHRLLHSEAGSQNSNSFKKFTGSPKRKQTAEFQS